jgi:hypothetical protein
MRNVCRPTKDSDIFSLIERAIEKSQKLLHIYVETSEEEIENNCVKVFSLANHLKCSISCEFSQSRSRVRQMKHLQLLRHSITNLKRLILKSSMKRCLKLTKNFEGTESAISSIVEACDYEF